MVLQHIEVVLGIGYLVLASDELLLAEGLLLEELLGEQLLISELVLLGPSSPGYGHFILLRCQRNRLSLLLLLLHPSSSSGLAKPFLLGMLVDA
jgi:hypothetical protein